MPGVVKIVEETDFVGVIAESHMEAEFAKEALDAEWKVDRNWQTEDIEDMIRVGQGEPYVIQKEGRAKRVLGAGNEIVEAEYHSPIGAHAQLEPNGAVAFVEDDKATIWISTQVVKITRDEVANILDMNKDQVIIEPTFLGGGFGGRLHTPHAMQVALMSKAVGATGEVFF